METSKLRDCIALCKMAYEEEELAKSDCKAKVEAALDQFVASSKTSITKDDKAAIAATAKAQAKEAVEEYAAKVASQVDILEASGAVPSGEISLHGFFERNKAALEAAKKQLEMFS